MEAGDSAKGRMVPIARVDVAGPKAASYKAAVLRGVREGVTSGLGVPDARVTVQLVEIAPGEWSMPASRTERFTVVEITLFEGRTREIKRSCIDAIRHNLSADPGIDSSEIAVIFNEKNDDDLNVVPGKADS